MVLGFLWRLLVAVLTVVPSEDGVNYLWMAERFAEGNAAAALSEVFPPLLPLLTAPLIWSGADPFRGAQVLLALAGALAVLPIARASEVMLKGSGAFAGSMAAVAHLPVRFAAEIYTEPLFILVGAFALWAGVRRRWWLLGLLAGVGFWLRPEAVLLPLGFLFCRPRDAWRALVPLGLLVLALASWRAALGMGFNLSPKLTFNWERTVFATDTNAFLTLLRHLLQLPWLWIEAFSLMGVAALLGAARRRENVKPVLWTWLLVLLLIAAFLPRRRFLVGWMFTVAPVAAIGITTLARRWQGPVILTIVLLGLLLGLRVTDPNRTAERDLGRHLYNVMSLEDGATLTGDMTRVLYFARRRPLPPRHFTAEQLVDMATHPKPARFVVLATEKPTAPMVEQRLRAHARAKLPSRIAGQCADRGILVLERVERPR